MTCGTVPARGTPRGVLLSVVIGGSGLVEDTPGDAAAAADSTPVPPAVTRADLRRALAERELEVWVQPKTDIRTGRVAAAEALLRWRRPDHGVSGPAEILTAAAAYGAMTEVTRYVLAEALSWCSQWRASGLTLPIAVNVAPGDLAEESLPELVEQLLDDFRLPGELLTLEITETAMLQEPARSSEVMQRLRRLGVMLSADDFGVGYSSLSRLVQLPLSELKVDMSLIFGMHSSPHGADAVRAIVDLGHTLGMRVVAEGVENQRTLDDLRRFGCDLAQGYLIARPMPAADIPTWTADHSSAALAARGRDERVPEQRHLALRATAARLVDIVGAPALAWAGGAFALYLAWQIVRWGGAAHQELIGDSSFVPINGAAIALCWLAGRQHRHDPRLRWGWWWLSAAWASYLLGDLIQMWYEIGLHRTMPFPSWSDAAYISFYPMALIGLLSFPGPRRSKDERFTLALDIGVVAIGAASLVWTVYLSPRAATGTGLSLTAATSVAYPVGDMVLLFGVISLLMRGAAPEHAVPMRMLAGGLGLLLITDLIYGQLQLHGNYTGGDPVDTGWIAAMTLFSLGAVACRRDGRRTQRRLAGLPRAAGVERPRVTRLPYLAVLVAFGLLVVTTPDLRHFPAAGLLCALGIQTVLVITRQATAVRDVTRLVGRNRELASTDSLTGLFTRRHCLELAEDRFAEAHHLDRCLTVLMIDIDRFRQINDRFGHQTGDQVLRAVADVARTQLRAMDLVGRYGGDQFVAVLPDTSADEGQAIAERLQERLRDLLVRSGIGAEPATVSIGVAQATGARSLDALLATVDVALHEAKQAGRNCVRLSTTPQGASTEAGPRPAEAREVPQQ